MTMPLEETWVSVDADLDTADDDKTHLNHACVTSGPAIAWCGELKICRGRVVLQSGRPDVCRACDEIADARHSWCPNCKSWV